MGLVVAVVAAVVAVASYVTWTAGRLDRLHVRTETAAAALDAQLVRRAAAAAQWVGAALLVRSGSPALAAVEAAAVRARQVDGLGEQRQQAENALSRALRAVADEVGAGADAGHDAAQLRTSVTKVGYARQFYNDAVRDTLTLRRRRVPRLLRLYGSAPAPAYFDIDDSSLGHRRADHERDRAAG